MGGWTSSSAPASPSPRVSSRRLAAARAPDQPLRAHRPVRAAEREVRREVLRAERHDVGGDLGGMNE
eukprot:scaffold107917_cov57-Phaeocystis_antarctica.AAC.2